MIKIENHCCGCAVPSYPCRGSLCPLRRVEVHYCDECGRELEVYDIQVVDKKEYCQSCYEEKFGKIDEEEEE